MYKPQLINWASHDKPLLIFLAIFGQVDYFLIRKLKIIRKVPLKMSSKRKLSPDEDSETSDNIINTEQKG